MQISSMNLIYNNKHVDFGCYQNKKKTDKNSSLAPSLKNTQKDSYEDVIKNLEKAKENLKLKINDLNAKDDLDSNIKNNQLKQFNEQIANIEQQIQQIQAEKQKEKIEKEKDEAEKQAEKQNEQKEKNNKYSDKDLGGAIVDSSLVQLISASKDLSYVHNLKESQTRLKAENLDIEYKTNDKRDLSANSYRARKLAKNFHSIKGLESENIDIIKTSTGKVNKVVKKNKDVNSNSVNANKNVDDYYYENNINKNNINSKDNKNDNA